MTHLPVLIEDLALILCAAGVFTLLFKRLRQPQVLGYLIAGFLTGPHFHLFPSVTDTHSIETWAEIGVIFLLFSLGLEFSFKKLVKVGGPAGITAVVEVLGMLLLGYLTGKGLGWSSMDSLFLGGILSISSTTIIIRAFDETGVKMRSFARLVFGILIVEDLVAILLLVLLSTIGVSRQFQGRELIWSLLRLGFFIIVWFVGGIFLIPTFLRRTKALMSPESLLIVAVALCMGMVILCTQAGFSAPLGAFIMGSIFAETLDAEKIEHLIQPLKDLFGAVFFISVGMLIDPAMLWKYIGPILLITGITVLGKFLTSGMGALLSGQSLKTSVKTGLSLAQIGEFSFIIATLGLSLKVTSSYLYPIAVAVSALTTFTTPYLIKGGDRIYLWIVKMLPKRWRLRLTRYGANTQTVRSDSAWKVLFRRYCVNLLLLGVILLAIVGLSDTFLAPFIRVRLGAGEVYGPYLTAALTLGVMAPFLWAMAFRPLHGPSNSAWKAPLLVLDVVRILLALALVTALLDIYFPTWVAIVTALVCCAAIYFVFAGRLRAVYQHLEDRFLGNLGEREAAAKDPSPESRPGSEPIPRPDPNSDGGPDMPPASAPPPAVEVVLRKIPIHQESILAGQTIASLGLETAIRGVVAGVEREGKRMLRPPTGMVLKGGDVLWVVGDEGLIAAWAKV